MNFKFVKTQFTNLNSKLFLLKFTGEFKVILQALTNKITVKICKDSVKKST